MPDKNNDKAPQSMASKLAPELDPPIWGIELTRDDETKVFSNCTYREMLMLLITPLGIAVNNDKLLIANIFRNGVQRARLETFPPGE